MVLTCDMYATLARDPPSQETEEQKVQYRFLGDCPPNPPLSQHFALSEKEVVMLT